VDDQREGEGAVTDSEIALSAARRFKPVGILDAGDYAAIALLAVWQARQRWRKDGGARWANFAWQAAYHAILNALNAAMRWSAEPYPEGWNAADTRREGQPEQAVMDRETMRRAWSLLSDKQRVYFAGLIQGRTRAEIQRSEGVCLNAAADTMRCIRRRLRILCEDYL
jgi:DNA-directed RNA polymerase specialized sigma24 family protein